MKINKIIAEVKRKKTTYARQIERLQNEGKETGAIEKVVNKSIDNLTDGISSFVIFGEPQSGKTEMMIGLSGKLIETTKRLIIVLVPDSLRLLGQNTNRFITSRINPKPKILHEFLEGEISPTRIVLCKKNRVDLENLIMKTQGMSKVIIDDEADTASPNGKINKKERTKINELIETLLEEDGIYIGVTATPARLDLNNTFKNRIENWIHFQSHSNYVGKDVFFPASNEDISYNIEFIEDTPSNEELEKAILYFILDVAMVNVLKNSSEKNYAFLVHTSGNKSNHTDDAGTIRKVFDVISNDKHPEFDIYIKRLASLVKENISSTSEREKILEYILINITNHTVIKVNSDKNKTYVDLSEQIPNLFTVPVGGNMVSRGLTIDNLLGMYFTRDVKRMQQDTYIQRARMFGNRKEYLDYFRLWIPEKLFMSWRSCFIYHDFAIESIKSGMGAPAWVADEKVFPVAANSIDKQTINVQTNEISFESFYCDAEEVKKIMDGSKTPIEMLSVLNESYGNQCLPNYIINFVTKHSNQKDIEVNIDYKESRIKRRTSENQNTVQHRFWICFISQNKAKVFYSFSPKKMKYISTNTL
ncbi:Z1 domain-containing protein [Rossellomorea sp. NS-SX7]|uniref:Z1 domain-containing protein n=1 Tax=Rossellomorea sp. NS-SX7 TaxID=3463856 RepID=UPI004058572D